VRIGQVRTSGQSSLGLCPAAFIIALKPEYSAEERTGLCICAVECDRAPSQCFSRPQTLRQIARPKVRCHVDLSGREAPIASGKSRIEVDRLLKELLCNCVVVRSELAEMPQAALIGGPGVEAPRQLADGPLPLGFVNGGSNGDRHRLGISSCTAKMSARSRS
jgi:hypothetical protein